MRTLVARGPRHTHKTMDTLPNELLAKIARYVHQMRQQDPDPGIRALMTVSKRCSAVSKRFLYRSIRHQHLVHPALLKALQDPAVVQLIEQAELTASLQEIPDFTKPFHALRYCTALTRLILNYESIEDLASEVSDGNAFICAPLYLPLSRCNLSSPS